MARLQKVELHLAQRAARSQSSLPSIFGPISVRSYPVRMFDKSPHLHVLMASIKEDAEETKEHLRKEFYFQKEIFDRLLDQSSIMSCDKWWFREGPKAGTYEHRRSCGKCSLVKQANRMSIKKFEEPLPAYDAAQKAVVFELQPGTCFAAWRDATWIVLKDILSTSIESGVEAQLQLSQYEPLKRHFQPSRRICLASVKKPHSETHRFVSLVTTAEDAIFLPHAATYELYDSGRVGVWTKDQSGLFSVARFCQAQIGKSPYSALIETLRTTTTSQNSVIARQSSCPVELSIHDWVVYGSLRSGACLQSINLLRTLLTGELDLWSPATIVMIEQILHEAGEAAVNHIRVVRKDHVDFQNASFVQGLLQVATSMMDRIETNWKETNTGSLLRVIIQRVLSMTRDLSIIARCLDLIQRLRSISLTWVSCLAATYAEQRIAGTSAASLEEIRRRILDAAMLARATWCVEDEHVHALLQKEIDYAQLIACSVYIHDFSKYFENTKDKWLSLCAMRDRLLAIELEATISKALNSRPSILMTGIRLVWPQADVDGSFHALNAVDDRWWSAKRLSCESFIHYNVLTGSLLVGGKPLSTLPDNYIEQGLYQQLFGDRSLDVVASSDPKMEFMTSKLFDGHEIHFGFRDAQLQIYAKKEGRLYIAVQRDLFDDDLPRGLICDTNPWLCLQTLQVEFRKSLEHWSSQPAWTLSPLAATSPMYIMQSDKHFVIDNRRGIGQIICSILCNFELRCYVHVLQNKQDGEISVELPRYHLNFVLNQHGQLKCNELAAVVAPTQAVGTLHGLRSRLVLQSQGSDLSNPKRWVLIPYGEVQIKHHQPHITVEVDINGYEHVAYFQYSIDTTLGQLSAAQVEAHLWKAYLHALTSSCLPDSLTECTGVEQSFVALKDTLVQTCVPFSVTSQQILEKISQLAPIRSFYPSDARRMQTVIWSEELSFLTQHDLFFEIVQQITRHNQNVQFLHPEIDFVIPGYRGTDKDLILANRAKWAWEKLQRTGFIADTAQPKADKIYKSRDVELSRDTSPLLQIAEMIEQWKPLEWDGKDIYTMLSGWRSLKGFGCLFSSLSLTDSLSVDIRDSWPALVTTCLHATKEDKHKMLFIFSLMAFGKPELLSNLVTLLCFAMLPTLKEVDLPEETEYDLSTGSHIDWNIIEDILEGCRTTKPVYKPRALEQYDGLIETEEVSDASVAQQHSLIETAIRAAWPRNEVVLPDGEDFPDFDVSKLLSLINGRIAAWSKNHALHQHCKSWQLYLSSIRSNDLAHPRNSTLVCPPEGRTDRLSGAFPSLLQRMKQTDVRKIASRQPQSTNFDMSISTMFTSSSADVPEYVSEHGRLCSELEHLVESEFGTMDDISTMYRQGLLDSVSALKHRPHNVAHQFELPSREALKSKLEWIDTRIHTLLGLFKYLCTPRSAAEHGLSIAELWPKATTSAILQLLSRKHRTDVPDEWRILLIGFAREVTSRQRIQRLIRFVEANDRFAVRKELENVAHASWNLQENLDWLLIEIQNDILIRPVQIKVARSMIEPVPQVLQVLMGEGKSSVILPLFCTSVADGETLVRVIVLKSLAKETLRTLSKALSGLVGRPVFWLPFSRSSKITKATASEFRNLWKECRTAGGVLLALPEHLNSFRLIGNDQLVAGRALAGSLLSAQKWLDKNARDIIDESDIILRPSYELVYTNGEDKPLSGTPYRWTLLLSVLNLVQLSAEEAHAKAPHGIEYKKNELGEFATVRVLDDTGSTALLQAILDRIATGEVPTFVLDRPKIPIEEILTFIRKVRISGQLHQMVKCHFTTPEDMLAIFLLRGLFAWGYLGAALRKRYMVEYGLHRARCMSAVPYRSKGVPAPASEFAQPDMMVLLTALSYYYTGLQLDDMRTALAILLRLPYAAEEFSSWLQDSTVPVEYSSVSSINIQDDACVQTLHQCLKKRKTTIDFYLKTVVLAKESKEYPFKLSSSAWDLCAGNGAKVASGFSGTTDALMPDVMPRKTLPELLHFDAAVLLNLLQPRNRGYLYAGSLYGAVLETDDLLKLITEHAPDTSVIIDVGAQTLDRNEDIAFMWLELRTDKLAAVFFNESDDRMVVTRDGSLEAWVSSPFKEQIDRCLIYLDQYHTRGTDFSLPDDFAAAVLLGPKLERDAFVQGCMRLRKLAYSQKVVAIGSPEVDNDIRTLLSKDPEEPIDVADVIKWTIHNSCQALRGQQTLHAMRGLEFMKRNKAFERQVNDHGVVNNRAGYIDNIRSAEVSDVERLYPVGVNSLVRPPMFSKHERVDKEVQKLLREWQNLDKSTYWEASKNAEQEREQLHEIEQEREVQRPKSMNAKVPLINEHLEDIIVNDRSVRILPRGTVSAFELMGSTSLFSEPLRRKFPSGLVATHHYLFAVKSATGVDHDDFLRPVYWILKLKLVPELILIGPHEVQEFLPYLRRSTVATLMVYSAKVTKEMTSFDTLDVYTVPERAEPVEVDANILTCLKIFAGQLYFSNFDEYERFCVLLGLPRPCEAGSGGRNLLQLSHKTIHKPNFVPIVKRWIDMRRKGLEWGYTHVGRVLNGERLGDKDFE